MEVKSRITEAMIRFPQVEAQSIVEASEQIEKTIDREAVKWCAQRLSQLHLYKMCIEELKNNPPPESIAAIINRDKPESITAEDAKEALCTVEKFLEHNMGGKRYRAALKKLDTLLSAAIKTKEAGQ